MADLAPKDHNQPPAKFAIREEMEALAGEIENWLDGTPVATQAQSDAVDKLVTETKSIRDRLDDEKELEYRPHKTAADAVVAEYKPDLGKLADWLKGLNGLLTAYKVEAQRVKDAIAAEARRKEQEASRIAQIADEQADYSNLAERREADELAQAARIAQMDAQAAKKDKIGGLRTKRSLIVTDYRALINHIAQTDKPAIQAFCDQWAATYFRENRTSTIGTEIKTERHAV